MDAGELGSGPGCAPCSPVILVNPFAPRSLTIAHRLHMRGRGLNWMLSGALPLWFWDLPDSGGQTCSGSWTSGIRADLVPCGHKCQCLLPSVVLLIREA